MMIVSMHVPKTAGTSFRLRLEAACGSRLLCDYGDWLEITTPEAIARREARAKATRGRRDQLLHDYDVIHGHFVADKYMALFPNARFITFFRDPCQHAISGYQHVLRRPDLDHPAVKIISESRMTLIDSIAAFPDLQTSYMGSMRVEDLVMVGLTEQYERSIALFEAVFGRKLPPEVTRKNVNPNRCGDSYPIDLAIRKAIEKHRAGDVELYRRAQEKFVQLTARYGL